MVHVLQHRKQIVNLGGLLVFGFRQRGISGLQVFPNRQQRKDHPALRHIAQTAHGHALWRNAGHLFAVQQDGAARPQMRARRRFEKAGFANAIGNHDAGHLASACNQIDPVQDLRRTVMQGQAFGFQHLTFPDRRR
jgi:hypothetical protein